LAKGARTGEISPPPTVPETMAGIAALPASATGIAREFCFNIDE
jgi:hypothetical protein